MTTTAAGAIDPLPSGWRALRISARIAFGAAPWLGVASFVLVPFAWVSGTLFTVLLARLVDARSHRSIVVTTAALAALISSRWLVDALRIRAFKTFEERISVALERECLE